MCPPDPSPRPHCGERETAHGTDWHADAALLAVLGALYTLLHIPLALNPIPTTYHTAVQLTTVEVAISTAQTGLPYAWVVHQSFAGANLHGILAAPIVLVGWPLEATRLVMLTVGAVTIGMFVAIGRAVGARRPTTALGALLLVLTPQFLLFTGLMFPQAVTIAFGVASVFAYLRFAQQEGRWLAWAFVSAVAAGLATLNHFWGGVVTVTVLALDALVLAATREVRGLSIHPRRHAMLWGAHAVALVPAGTLYAWYKIRGLGGHYGDYLLTTSWPLLFDSSWWTTQFDTLWRLATTVPPPRYGRARGRSRGRHRGGPTTRMGMEHARHAGRKR